MVIRRACREAMSVMILANTVGIRRLYKVFEDSQGSRSQASASSGALD